MCCCDWGSLELGKQYKLSPFKLKNVASRVKYQISAMQRVDMDFPLNNNAVICLYLTVCYYGMLREFIHYLGFLSFLQVHHALWHTGCMDMG